MSHSQRSDRAVPDNYLTLDELKRVRGRSVDFVRGYRAREAIIRVGQLIREHRQAADLNQTELAELAGLTQSEISRLESGSMRRGAGVEILNRVAAALGMRLDMTLSPLSEVDKRKNEGATDERAIDATELPEPSSPYGEVTVRVRGKELEEFLKGFLEREISAVARRRRPKKIPVSTHVAIGQLRRFSWPVRRAGNPVGTVKVVRAESAGITVILSNGPYVNANRR